jgi:dTDP-4-amino-4,6-dideoxygalactose transaminase
MTDIGAALGIHQLRRLGAFQARRLDLVRLYDELLSPLDGVFLPRPPSYADSAWHLYCIGIDEGRVACSRNQVIEMLGADNIGVSVHFIPIHYHPFYQRCLGCTKGDFPNATRQYERAISLPLFPEMSSDDVVAVARSLTRIIRENRK